MRDFFLDDGAWTAKQKQIPRFEDSQKMGRGELKTTFLLETREKKKKRVRGAQKRDQGKRLKKTGASQCCAARPKGNVPQREER